MTTHEKWLRDHPKSTRIGGRPQHPIPPGTRFGRLVVVGPAPAENKRSRSVCRCDCGTEVVRTNASLRQRLKSCGCLLADAHKKHGGSRRKHKERLWRILQGMISRCRYEKIKIYKYYGGRGIRVCEEWEKDYSAFRSWAMENGYRDGLSIDRIDPNGNYEPNNCRWVTQKEQCNNKRNNRKICIDGVERTIADWCKELGASEKLARSRASEGKVGLALFAPRQRTKKNKGERK